MKNVPIAARVAYGVGKAPRAYFESGKRMDAATLRDRYLEAVREAKDIKWNNINHQEER